MIALLALLGWSWCMMRRELVVTIDQWWEQTRKFGRHMIAISEILSWVTDPLTGIGARRCILTGLICSLLLNNLDSDFNFWSRMIFLTELLVCASQSASETMFTWKAIVEMTLKLVSKMITMTMVLMMMNVDADDADDVVHLHLLQYAWACCRTWGSWTPAFWKKSKKSEVKKEDFRIFQEFFHKGGRESTIFWQKRKQILNW